METPDNELMQNPNPDTIHDLLITMIGLSVQVEVHRQGGSRTISEIAKKTKDEVENLIARVVGNRSGNTKFTWDQAAQLMESAIIRCAPMLGLKVENTP